MRAFAGALIALLLLAPAANAADASGLAARFEADDLSASGRGATSGMLAALVLAAPPGRDGPPVPEAGLFVLRAQNLTVEADYELWAYELALTSSVDARPKTHTRSYGSAEVRSDAARGAYALAILPADSARLQTTWTAVTATPSPLESVAVINPVNNTPERRIEAQTVDSLGVAFSETPTSFIIEGDFRVALWYWNVTVLANDRPSGVEEWSGEYSDPIAPGVQTPEGIRTNVHRQQLVLDVQGGVLEFTRPPSAPITLLARDLQLGGVGTWTLHGAEGLLGDGNVLRSASARQVALQGSLQVAADAQGDNRIHADIQGRLETATLDGVPAVWAATVVAGNEAWRPGAWSLAVAGIALAPAAAWSGQRARRRMEQRRLESLELSMGVGDYESVARAAPRLARTAFARDAAALHIEALLQLGRIDDARTLVAAQNGWDGPAAADLDLVRGLVAAHAGQNEEAVAHVGRALRAAPEFRAEILGRPVFSTIRQDPRLRPLLRGRSDTRARTSIAYA